MIDLDDIVVGAKVWYGSIDFSRSTFRAIYLNYPNEYTIKKLDKRPTQPYMRDIITLVDRAGKELKLFNISARYGKGLNTTFYESEKEIYKDGWEPCLLEELDRLEYFYQEKKKYLSQKLHGQRKK